MSSVENMLHVLRMPVPDVPAGGSVTTREFITLIVAVLFAGVFVLVGFHRACSQVI